ncbi:MAG: hypothetical protein JSS12_01785, partial [Verrucomicrobia bacterium]|nr:hypothetical protein [Verrucomicrobiota bacterium]
MTGIFGGLPSDNIKEVERLYKSVDDALKAKPNTKISDLFCIKTSQGLEFINKHSLQGRWEAFKNRISMLFGGQNRLNLASNLTEATELLTKVSKLDKKFFQEPETAKEHLYELAHQLIQLHAHAMESKSLRGKDLKPLSSVKFTMFTEKLPVLSDEQRDPIVVAKQLRSAFPNLTEKQALKAGQFLNTYADRGEIFQQLDRLDEKTPPSVVKQQLMPLLQQAILKAISFSSEAETDAFQQIYSKIAPAQAAESSSVTDRNIGMVFGDSFISGSGLEGDVNSRPYAELMAECLAQESLPQTEKSKALQKVLKNSISLRSEYSLSAKELKTELEKKIASDGSCLILGGWSGHAIVYEIQKQPNGKYSFRVFNEGAGIEYHRHTQDKYRDKVDGCIAFCDIPEDMIFKKAFLGSLQALISLSSTNVGAENPAALLVNHILPMLGGKRETVPPEVQSQVSPQRSGTCTYKSLLAWLANSMSQQEYKLAKIELKLYMLESYLPTMQKLAKTAIKTECDYNDLRRTYSIISRSIEKFSTSLENLKLVLPSDKIAQAQDSILRYKRELPLFEAQILAYEKSINKKSELATTSQGPARFAVSNTAQYQPSDRAQGVAASHLLSLAATNLITAIDHTSPEEIVARIANLENIPPEEYTYILDLLLKKVGSVTEWQNIHFREPEQAFANVKKIANYLAKGISKHSAAADYARYFTFTLALETAYNQSGFKPSLGASILDPTAIHTLTSLQCSDPFWVKKIQELFLTSLKSSRLTYATYTNASSKLELGQKITDAIISWYIDPQNAAFKDKIQVSVRADRETQKREIAKLIREQEERLAHAKAEVIRLNRTIAEFESLKQTPEIVIELITLRNDKNAYTSIIDTHDAIIANIPKLVREDKRYWPWGFLEPSDVDPYLVKDRQFIASFLFAKQGFFYDKGFQTDDLIPAHFRSLLAACAINLNIFQKESTSTSLPEHPNRFMVGTESFPDVIRFKN